MGSGFRCARCPASFHNRVAAHSIGLAFVRTLTLPPARGCSVDVHSPKLLVAIFKVAALKVGGRRLPICRCLSPPVDPEVDHIAVRGDAQATLVSTLTSMRVLCTTHRFGTICAPLRDDLVLLSPFAAPPTGRSPAGVRGGIEQGMFAVPELRVQLSAMRWSEGLDRLPAELGSLDNSDRSFAGFSNSPA